MLGAAMRKENPEYHLSLRYKPITISAYYQAGVKIAGMVTQLQTKKIYSILVYQHSLLMSNTTVVPLQNKISLYNDLGYSFQSQQIVRLESGVFKSFTTKIVKGMVSLSYDGYRHTANTYIFVHL